MSVDTSNARFLRTAEPARYARNFLQQVVCELRFPTLFELNDKVPPEHFARALRKKYPHHSHQVQEINVNGDSVDRSHVHVFQSKALDFSVTLRPSAITLEATKYQSFEDLVNRIDTVLELAPDVIDSDFFTRIGLRYINAIPMNIGDAPADVTPFKGWVRDELVAPLFGASLGTVSEYAGRIGGTSDFGGYMLRHGIGQNSKTLRQDYVLDFDFWQEPVELAEAIATIRTLHAHQFTMFDWSLGPKAKEYLGPSILGSNS
jgi:uncharacterized protein (TIGR04255 family)